MQEGFYDEYARAEAGHWWFTARRRVLETVIDGFVTSGAGRVVLDVGTGGGGMEPILSRFGRVVGTDVSWRALELTRSHVERLVAASLEALPFRTGAFDAVFACDVIEHVDDDGQALRELRRISAVDGRLVLTVPAYQFLWSVHDEINGHRRRYTRRGLGALLDAAGWRAVRLSYFNTILFPPIAALRLLGGRRRPADARHSDLVRTPRVINGLLEAVFAAERHLVRHVDLPFGVSLLCLATPR